MLKYKRLTEDFSRLVSIVVSYTAVFDLIIIYIFKSTKASAVTAVRATFCLCELGVPTCTKKPSTLPV